MSLLFATLLASGPTYVIASRDTPELRSRTSFTYAGQETSVPERDSEPVRLPDTVVPARVNGAEVICAAPELDCAFILDDPQLGLIIVRTPPVPGAIPYRTPARARDLARDLHHLDRHRHSPHRKPGPR